MSIDTGLWKELLPWSLICTVAPLLGFVVGAAISGKRYLMPAAFWMIIYYLAAFIVCVPIFPILVPGGVVVGIFLVCFASRPDRHLPVKGGEQRHCKACGYNLTGNVSGICPECGTVIPRRELDALVDSKESRPL